MKNLRKYIISFHLAILCIVSYSQIPVLNSYPVAKATIYLDFDGQTVSGTSWNINGPIVCGPANLTSDRITEIVNRVSEDYRPFAINITTDSTMYWAAPANQRIRIILTVTNGWYGSSAGGVSYIGSFTWGDNTPSFVFTSLLQYNAKYIGEAVSHEAGHTLGLRHQSSYDINCAKLSEYNPGTGSGEISWAPIMGLGYYKNQTLWHNGSNPFGCNDMQDDLGIIKSNIIEGYRMDDHGNDASQATQASFSNNQFALPGIIETQNDKDMIQFQIPSFGNFHLDAIPFNIGSNDAGSDLDIQLDLYQNDQTLIGTYNPIYLLSSSIDTILNPGTYYIRVQAKGNMYAPEYASLGSYTLNAMFIPGTVLPIHKLQLNGKYENGKNRLDWTIIADEPITGQFIEISLNGRDFNWLADPGKDSRSFYATSANTDIVYYRIKLTLSPGQVSYSNIVALKQEHSKQSPDLKSTVIRNTLTVVSPTSYNYVICDLGGMIIYKGIITEGSTDIITAKCTTGMYIIRFYNNTEEISKKFIVQ
ncbi:MAG: T9SS type A sorting domain-containing protein [Flavisolibacter sp.]